MLTPFKIQLIKSRPMSISLEWNDWLNFNIPSIEKKTLPVKNPKVDQNRETLPNASRLSFLVDCNGYDIQSKNAGRNEYVYAIKMFSSLKLITLSSNVAVIEKMAAINQIWMVALPVENKTIGKVITHQKVVAW